MQISRVKRVGALLVGLTLVAAACGSDDDASSSTDAPVTTEAVSETTEAMTETTEAPTTEATRNRGTRGVRATPPMTDGDLAGFSGTTPFGQITPEFIDRLCEIDPELTDLNYATETYDAVMISALAVPRRAPTASRTPKPSTASPVTARSAPPSPTVPRSSRPAPTSTTKVSPVR